MSENSVLAALVGSMLGCAGGVAATVLLVRVLLYKYNITKVVFIDSSDYE